MCGICGYIYLDKSKSASGPVLDRMMEALVHRGPDDRGSYVKGNAALGHRRLSIIDLKTGHQPMLSGDGSVVIVYNGEVYNFKEIRAGLAAKGRVFRTSSDTEVILRAYEEYGEDCLKYFNGMFAIAIWDSGAGSLFLARDRFGKKPVYYSVSDGQFIFGSELKAVLRHPSIRKEIDRTALARYLAYEYVPSPLSIFKGIYKLQAGHRLTLKDGKIAAGRYWNMPMRPGERPSVKEAEDGIRDLFTESVRRRLVSDVPLGVFLSGGIDSSIVVSAMAEIMDPKDIRTFSIGFREKAFDESADARLVAGHFGTDHHERILDSRGMLRILPDVLDTLDEPFADSSIIPTYLVSRFTREYVKVALGGDGGDELFMGYPSFAAHRIDSTLPPFIKGPLLKAAARMVPFSNDYMSLNFKIRRFLKGLDFPEPVRHQAWIGSFTPPEQKSLFLPASEEAAYAGVYGPTSGYFDEAAALDPFSRAMYIYIKTYMTDDILAKVDRASMANSLEVRAPFLDTDFAEFAFNLPSEYKMRGSDAKWILKKAFARRLPPATLKKRKQGFAVPVAAWLKNELRPLLLEAFDRRKIAREGIFDPGRMEALVGAFLKDKDDTRKEIWALFIFEMWYDRWAV